MGKVDKKKFAATLREDARHQGERCHDARNSDDGDVIAAAITISQLVNLRSMAGYKVLTSNDIQEAIDAFADGAGVQAKRNPMGGETFIRKQSFAPAG